MNNIKIGDRVTMNNNYFVSEKDKGKIWTVRSNPWNCCGTIVVLLEGKSGGYAIDGLNIVERLPAADAVKVVRCKDCRYRDFLDSDYGGYYCEINRIEIHLDDFCSKGERKDG